MATYTQLNSNYGTGESGPVYTPLFATAETVGRYPKEEGFLEGALNKVVGIGKFASDFIPGGRYVWEDARDEFNRMSPDEKVNTLAFGVLGGAALWAAGGPIARGVGKGGKALAGKLGIMNIGKKSVAPIEDLLTYKATKYADDLPKYLRKQGFSGPESNAVRDLLLHGDQATLNTVKATGKWQKSKAFKENIRERKFGGMRDVEYKPRTDFVQSIPTPEQIRRVAVKSDMEGVVKRVLGDDNYTPDWLEGTFRAYAKRHKGMEDVRRLADATDEQMNAVLTAMQGGERLIRRIADTGMVASLRPVQSVLGKLEPMYGTYRNVYKPISIGAEASNAKSLAYITTFFKTLEQRGFGKFNKKGKFIPDKDTFNEGIKSDINTAMHKTREMMGHARHLAKGDGKGNQETAEQLLREINELRVNPAVREGMEATSDFFNKLYKDELLFDVRRTFEKAGLTGLGQQVLDDFLGMNAKRIDKMFDTTWTKLYPNHLKANIIPNPVARTGQINQFLDEAKQLLNHTLENPRFIDLPDLATSPLFKKTGMDLVDDLTELAGNLTMRGRKAIGSTYEMDGKITPYIEGYVAKLTGKNTRSYDVADAMPSKFRAWYTKQADNLSEMKNHLAYDDMIRSRVRAQAKNMHLYPAIEEAVKSAKSMPENVQNYIDHYVARIMGFPSRGDAVAARILETTVGKAESVMGKPGVWGPQRAMELSKSINDLAYTGFLGFRPFSAVRNLFQVMLNVPAELGGIKSYRHVAGGIKDVLTDKNVVKKLNNMGIITEFAPELSGRAGAWGKVRDAALWMFQGSDKWNRYTTGAAALRQFNNAVKKMPQIAEGRGVGRFMKASGSHQRRPWISDEIYASLKKGDVAEAEKLFVKDAVAVSQYLYGITDSPLITQYGGFFGRTGAIFQSWWMHYGDMLSRWATTGTAPEKADRLFTWALSSAMIASAMGPVWGESTAKRTVGFGPFPSNIIVPPSWEPAFHAAKGIIAATSFDFDRSKEELWKVADTASTMSIPGALQLKQSYKGVKKEGVEGLVKSILKLRFED